MARILEYDLNLLTNYLIKYPYDEIKLTIDEIEKITCGKLPNFMHTYSGSYRFWYNDYNRNPTYAHYWLDAGYFAHPDFNNSVVYFTKTSNAVVMKKQNNIKHSVINKPQISIETAINAIEKYHYSVNNNYTRYKSWEHCYNAFKKYRKDESKTELLCLHLSCYLASWGMLRNSGLMNYDYFVHKLFVEEISNPKYDKLYNDFCDIDTIFQAVAMIENSYPDDVSITDTFKTKILLGVFGCAPAYDRYFKQAVKKYKVCYSKFNERSMVQLYSFYNENKDAFENLRKQFESNGTFYPPMKLMDMCFWQIGIDLKKEKS